MLSPNTSDPVTGTNNDPQTTSSNVQPRAVQSRGAQRVARGVNVGNGVIRGVYALGCLVAAVLCFTQGAPFWVGIMFLAGTAYYGVKAWNWLAQ